MNPETKLVITVAQANELLQYLSRCTPPPGVDNAGTWKFYDMLRSLQPAPEPKAEPKE